MRRQRIASDGPAHQPKQDPRSEAERSLQARQAAHAMHARHDSRQTSAKGRAAFLARFEREVDPTNSLDPQERQRRADHARRAYFVGLSRAAARARRAKRAARGETARGETARGRAGQVGEGA